MDIVKNKEFTQTLIRIAALMLCLAAAFLIYWNYTWNQLNKELIQRDIAIVGKMATTHPGLAEVVVQSFTRELSQQELDQGVAIAKKYGYTDEMPLSISPVMKKFHNTYGIGIVVLLTLASIFLLLVVYGVFRYLYNRMKAISLGAEKIMAGDFDIRFPEEGEGELPILGFQFNQMARRLQLTLEELKNEKELLKNMVSDISHQLKTPLASLKMFNELLLQEEYEPGDIRMEFLQKSNMQLDRMEWLTHTLLKISRLEAGVVAFEMKDNNLEDTLHQEISALEMKYQEKCQTVELEIGQVVFPHDRKWLGEALANLLKNAIDYTPEKGKISIQLQENDSTLVLIIQDSGVGISQEDLPHIFKRFYQGNKTRGMAQKGSGIGLALSRLIIEKHGGMIHVESIENKGATFTITFLKHRTI